MFYPIYLYGEDILRKKAQNADLDDPMLLNLIEDMFSTMRMANGSGLAAPQIGISKKIIVIEEKILDENTFKLVLINPVVLDISTSLTKFEEGCLSIPGINEDVIRPSEIEIQWFNENKIYNKQIFTGLQARIIQHELDHLEGKLFIDYLHPDVRMKHFMKLEDIKNKKITVNYPVK